MINQSARLETALTFPFPSVPGNLVIGEQCRAAGKYLRGVGLGAIPMTGPVPKAGAVREMAVVTGNNGSPVGKATNLVMGPGTLVADRLVNLLTKRRLACCGLSR